MIKALHAAGANVNTPMNDGRTPIHMAAQFGHLGTVKILCALGATNMNVSCNQGITPIYAAASNGHTEVVKTLHALGANVNIATYENTTPIFIAAQFGHVDVVKFLHAVGANVNTPMNDGITPIHIAAQEGHAEVIKALHTAGADVNQQRKGWFIRYQPLHFAANFGQALAVKTLLELNANVNKTVVWQTPLDMALDKINTATGSKISEYQEIIKILTEYSKPVQQSGSSLASRTRQSLSNSGLTTSLLEGTIAHVSVTSQQALSRRNEPVNIHLSTYHLLDNASEQKGPALLAQYQLNARGAPLSQPSPNNLSDNKCRIS